MKKKIMSKSNWFKKKRKESTDNFKDTDKETDSEVNTEREIKIVNKVDQEKKKSKKNWRKKQDSRNEGISDRKHVGKDMETVAVMFVDQTVGGLLAKRLQEAEDRISMFTGYRIRMVESSGTQLCRMLPNTNPWSGMDCTRTDCVPCGQGDEVLLDCKRRNLLYESVCWICEKEEQSGKKVPSDGKVSRTISKHGGVYVGETARSLYERSGEHHQDATNIDDDSHMVKHWLQEHPQEANLPEFRFRMVASFQDSLTRQVAESVRINMREGAVLNSKTEYSRCKLPRLTVDVEEWMKQRDIMMRDEQERDRMKMDEMVNTSVDSVDSSEKRKSQITDKNDGRRKKKRRRLEPLVEWGELPVVDEIGAVQKWLREGATENLQLLKSQKQKSIRDYSLSGSQETSDKIIENSMKEPITNCFKSIDRNQEMNQLARVDMEVSRKHRIIDGSGKVIDQSNLNFLFQGEDGHGEQAGDECVQGGGEDGQVQQVEEGAQHDRVGDDGGIEAGTPSGEPLELGGGGGEDQELVEYGPGEVGGSGGGVAVEPVGEEGGRHHVPDRRVQQARRRRKVEKKTTIPKNQPLLLDFLKSKAAQFTSVENSNVVQMGGPKYIKRKSDQMEGPDARVKVARLEQD